MFHTIIQSNPQFNLNQNTEQNPKTKSISRERQQRLTETGRAGGRAGTGRQAGRQAEFITGKPVKIKFRLDYHYRRLNRLTETEQTDYI